MLTWARQRCAFAVVVGSLGILAGCSETKDVEVVNPCSEQVVVKIWETPKPRDAKSDQPARAVVGPVSRVVAKDALADVGKDGSSLEIVSGPGMGEVISIPHDADLFVIIPATLCSANA